MARTPSSSRAQTRKRRVPSHAGAGVTELAPVIVQAAEGQGPGGLPAGGPIKPDLRNNHLSYAVTWYGLAVALVAVYLVSQFRRES